VKQKNKHTSPTAAEQGPRLICSANSPAQGTPLPPPAGASFFGEFLTSDNNLSLIAAWTRSSVSSTTFWKSCGRPPPSAIQFVGAIFQGKTEEGRILLRAVLPTYPGR
jgi:hypothetical protein